jgi:hypothetical protein
VADAGTTTYPGCRACLEDWRAWPDAWLGHDVDFRIERAREEILIRQVKRRQNFVRFATKCFPACSRVCART